MNFYQRLWRVIVLSTIIGLIAPSAMGYLFNFIGPYGGITEQDWLDDCIAHLRILRADCDDPELQGILDYTIQRYHRIGPGDVAVVRLWQCPYNTEAIARNDPLVPGITVDIDLLQYPTHDGAITVVHEALHDYFPYIGHAHITPREEKLEQLYEHVRRSHRNRSY